MNQISQVQYPSTLLNADSNMHLYGMDISQSQLGLEKFSSQEHLNKQTFPQFSSLENLEPSKVNENAQSNVLPNESAQSSIQEDKTQKEHITQEFNPEQLKFSSSKQPEERSVFTPSQKKHEDKKVQSQSQKQENQKEKEKEKKLVGFGGKSQSKKQKPISALAQKKKQNPSTKTPQQEKKTEIQEIDLDKQI